MFLPFRSSKINWTDFGIFNIYHIDACTLSHEYHVSLFLSYGIYIRSPKGNDTPNEFLRYTVWVIRLDLHLSTVVFHLFDSQSLEPVCLVSYPNEKKKR